MKSSRKLLTRLTTGFIISKGAYWFYIGIFNAYVIIEPNIVYL